MKNRIHSLLKTCYPFIIVSLILIVFMFSIESATYDGYTFHIQSGASELKITSGLDHIGDTIVIGERDVHIKDNQYSYIVKNRKGKSYDIDFIMPGGDSFSINQFTSSRVEFHNASKDVGHYGNASERKYDNSKLLIAAVLVHLRTVELYRQIWIYLPIIAIIITLGYYFYLKPLLMYNIFCKLLERKKGIPNIFMLKVINILFMALVSLTIFLLL